ncbi:glutamate receptor 2.7-like [Vigna radiata var. radiata]|uniref:Glutamate receptor n=1 Tax=Vigna radiata var. radiata TaxID=3916 RepID=A0A1S3VGI3_VIGRR|nr:glutamate receptor 2.7-like [Vigna radiata var. radiata]
MNFQTQTSKAVSNVLLRHSLTIFVLLIGAQVAYSFQNTIVGVVIDVNSKTGEQQRMAMQIAAQRFNNYSQNHYINLFFRDSGGIPLQAASSAEELIIKKKVEVILVMGTWQEATLVADQGNSAQIPIISFSSPPMTPPASMQHRWPFLIQMAKDQAAQINCIADIIHEFNWRKVIAIYEDNPYSGDSEMLSLFSEALQKGDSQIEKRLVLPSFTSLSDPKGFVLTELLKLLPLQSRVFVVLQATFPMITHLFREAKKIGLLGKDSAWIMNEGITSMLDFANKSVLSSMEGALGIKTYYSTSSLSYKQLQEDFQTEHAKPGSDALQAYDSVTLITKALERMNGKSSNSRVFLEKLLSSDFNGLSGNIRFKDGHLFNTPVLRVINVVNKEYKELDFWTPKFKFGKSLKILKDRETKDDYATNISLGPVVWPGGLTSAGPKGWKLPTNAEPLKVAIPINPAFENFLKEGPPKKYDGFCIRLFLEIIKILSDKYGDIPYEFESFNESYDKLLLNVITKSHDAIVGDLTILANRSKDVSFTQPYTDSSLSVIFPIETEGSMWLFMKPFSWEMWLATICILIYTMFTLWFLEHEFNPDFGGPLENQISTTLWFAFSSLFFAHRERIRSNSARVAVGAWLFLVFVINSSYTANLSSMLTVKRWSRRDIEWLKQNKLSVGCENQSSFVKNYMIDVYKFHPNQIINVHGEHDIIDKFKSKKMHALFFESPYERVFLNKYPRDYTAITAAYKFGGLGFAFQKGSPMAKEFSEAILELAENGKLKSLEEQWLTPPQCSNSNCSPETEGLALSNFWILYVMCAFICTICVVLSASSQT